MPNPDPKPSDKRDRLNIDLKGLRLRIEVVMLHPKFSFFREMKISNMVRHLITKGLEYYEAQIKAETPKGESLPSIADLVKETILPEDSLIDREAFRSIGEGLRPTDEQLVYLAMVLKKGEEFWSTHELMEIRDRDFANGEERRKETNGTH